MAITIGSYTAGTLSSNSSSSVTVPSCVAGETLLILHLWDGTATENAPTCSGETVATVGTQGAGMSSWTTKFRWHLIENIQSSGDKVVVSTLSAAPSSANCTAAWRLSGTDNVAGSPYDTSANATGTTANPSMNLTTAGANAAIVACCETNNGAPTAGSADWTIRTIFGSERAQDDPDVGAAGSKTVPFTHASTTNWGMGAIAIKAAGTDTSAALSGSAATGGHGTQSPVFSIEL